MSGVYPLSPMGPSKVHIKSVTPTRVSQAHNLRRQVRSVGSQRWGIKFSYSVLDRPSFAPILAHCVANRGQYSTFTTLLPGYTAPLGSWAGSPVVNGIGQTGYTVNLRGMTAGATGKAGDFLKFAGHTKVYLLTADFTADGTGAAAASITPALMATIADGEAVVVNNVPFTVAQVSDNFDSDIVAPLFHSPEVEMVEVF